MHTFVTDEYYFSLCSTVSKQSDELHDRVRARVPSEGAHREPHTEADDGGIFGHREKLAGITA